MYREPLTARYREPCSMNREPYTKDREPFTLDREPFTAGIVNHLPFKTNK